MHTYKNIYFSNNNKTKAYDFVNRFVAIAIIVNI